ncbi:MAG: DUF72 domain-containing protein [Candidatus Thorarchaeota archaeon]
MAKLYLGTAGFYYKDWVGTFYPKTLEKTHFLEYFSKYFNLVEINSTFYNLPSEDMVIHWKNRVSENFRFIIKVWQKITHDLDNPDLDSNIIEFFSRLNLLKSKVTGFLLQFPPWFKFSESHLEKLIQLIEKMPLQYNYIIELRDNSWYDIDILSKFIDGEKLILGTTYMPNIIPYYLVNQKSYYIRLIGDRKLKKFDRIQREQKQAIDHLYNNVKKMLNDSNIYRIFIIVNNHFQGAAPESVNLLKKKFGLSYHNYTGQKNLTDFLI